MVKIKKEIFHIFTSLLIILSVIFFGVVAMYAIISSALDKTNNSNTLFSTIRNTWCHDVIEEPQLSKGDKIVVLRLDDVQSFAWSDISIRMIRDAYEYNAPTVAGVIPKTIKDEVRIDNFLKRESCNIEIALHGWDHYGKPSEKLGEEYVTEFGKLDYESAKQRIGSGMKMLSKYRKKSNPVTFIPPFNVISEEARTAAIDLGIKVISAIGTGTYDYHSTTFNFDEKRIVPVQTVVRECKKAFAEESICVIMMHPQDYANKEKKLDEGLYKNYYIHLLDELKNEGVKFTTFERLIGSTL